MFRPRRPGRSDDVGSAQQRAPVRDVRPLRRLWALTGPYRGRLAWALLATLIASLVQLAFPLLARELFNDAFRVADGDPASAFGPGPIALVLVAVAVLQAAFNYLRVWWMGVVGERVVADLRKRLFEHLLTLSPTFFLRRKTGEITSRLTTDVATVQGLVSTSIAQVVTQAVTLLGGTVALLIIDASLTAVMLAVVPAVIIAAALFGRRLRDLSRDVQDAIGDANADAEEAIAGIRVVQSFTAESSEAARYARGIDTALQKAIRRVRMRATFVPSVVLAMFSGVTLVLWVGGRRVLDGALAPGDLIAFLLLTLFIAGSVAGFTGLYAQLQEGLGASRRIFELLDERSDLPPPADPVPMPRRPRRLQFDGVTFAYGPGEAPVLHEVTLEASPGEVIALVGPSGAGKSTLASLVPRFFDPSAGAVRIDGVDLRDVDPSTLRAAVGLVPQETLLLSGSVADNVRYGRPDAPFDQVVDAVRAANALAFVEELPDGWDTKVGERGLRLSGGQRQRIAIARALLKDPSLLVLDEATSSLDGESEAMVQEALERLMRGRTSLVIAHRLSTVVHADRIVVLDRGRIVQTGPHDRLVQEPGLYRTLFETQFRTTAPANA
ncbi:MAG: ABC transporter transmembrane domain-containing protein [Trueperaceae bacterium]